MVLWDFLDQVNNEPFSEVTSGTWGKSSFNFLLDNISDLKIASVVQGIPMDLFLNSPDFHTLLPSFFVSVA